MLYSRLYKKYYPLCTGQDIRNMKYDDRQELSRLIQKFDIEIKTDTARLIKRGYGKIRLNEVRNATFERIKRKLAVKEQLTDKEMKIVLDVLNAVIYRNKFIPFLSRFVCPRIDRHSEGDTK